MGAMEKYVLASKKELHEAIVAAINDFGRIGYMIESIGRKDDALEITCYPPRTKQEAENNPGPSMEGVSRPITWVSLSDNPDRALTRL
jgi:hypothetical protein